MKNKTRVRIVTFLSLILWPPSLIHSQQQSKSHYIRVDSIGRRSVVVGWRDMERINSQEYIISLRDEYLNLYFFYFPVKGDTLSRRQMQRLRFSDPRKLYLEMQDYSGAQHGSTEKLPFKIYMIRPTESKKWYVKAPLNYWSYLDYSKIPQE